MTLNPLSEEQESFFLQILEGDVSYIFDSINAGKIDPKGVLNDIEAIIQIIGSVWSQEHDIQGKLLVKTETFSFKQIDTFYQNIKPVFGFLRPRFAIKSSNLRIGVGTLLNKHDIAEFIELKLRSHGFLTYYFGHSLTVDVIKKQIKDFTPINVLILSIMAVNDELNGFNELKNLRKELSNLKIIVGGSAFQIITNFKDKREINRLSNPYRNEEFSEALGESDSLADFVRKMFNVEYADNFESLLSQLDK